MAFFAPEIIIPSALGSPANGNSMAADITSQPVICQQVIAASFGLSWTGTSPVGAVSIQGSNDFKQAANGQILVPGTWNTLTLNYGGSAVISIPISGNTGNGILDITLTGIYALRCIYTAISGTGNLTVTFCGKG